MTYVNKKDSRLMRLIGFLISPINKAFMTRYWTTIGSTVYYPTNVADPMDQRWSGVREHEAMHIAQFEKYGVFLVALAYLFFPLPFIFSGRWFIERYPYLNDIRKGRVYLENVVNGLWSGYGWPWPKSMMRAWFVKKLKEEDNDGD